MGVRDIDERDCQDYLWKLAKSTASADQWRKGDLGEKTFRRVLAASGLSHIPLQAIACGGAPMMKGPQSVVLPDFEVSYDYHRVYFDVKLKGGAVLYRIANEYRHGIDEHSYRHYAEMQARMRQPVCLAVLECFVDYNRPDEWSGSLLVNSFPGMGEPAQRYTYTQKNPESGRSETTRMVYWPRSRFVEVARLRASAILGSPFDPAEIRGARDAMAPFVTEAAEAAVQTQLPLWRA